VDESHLPLTAALRMIWSVIVAASEFALSILASIAVWFFSITMPNLLPTPLSSGDAAARDADAAAMNLTPQDVLCPAAIGVKNLVSDGSAIRCLLLILIYCHRVQKQNLFRYASLQQTVLDGQRHRWRRRVRRRARWIAHGRVDEWRFIRDANASRVRFVNTANAVDAKCILIVSLS
jgi:hypothetical protein